jgi:hypothetical protein
VIKKTILMGCDTKTCIYNDNGTCKEDNISIEKGKCTSIKSKVEYNKDGTWKRG